MAFTPSRHYLLACTIPAAVAFLVFVAWASRKKKKRLEPRIDQQKSTQSHQNSSNCSSFHNCLPMPSLANSVDSNGDIHNSFNSTNDKNHSSNHLVKAVSQPNCLGSSSEPTSAEPMVNGRCNGDLKHFKNEEETATKLNSYIKNDSRSNALNGSRSSSVHEDEASSSSHAENIQSEITESCSDDFLVQCEIKQLNSTSTSANSSTSEPDNESLPNTEDGIVNSVTSHSLNGNGIDTLDSCQVLTVPDQSEECEAEVSVPDTDDAAQIEALSLNVDKCQIRGCEDLEDKTRDFPYENGDEEDVNDDEHCFYEKLTPSPISSNEEPELQSLSNGNVSSAYTSVSHSPDDDIQSSIVVNGYSDNEGSYDSGQGGSEMIGASRCANIEEIPGPSNFVPEIEDGVPNTPIDVPEIANGVPENAIAIPENADVVPENSNAVAQAMAIAPEPSEYFFEIPSQLCGRMIGQQGRNVKNIRSSTGASVAVVDHPFQQHVKLCSVKGTGDQINAALAMVRNRFPINRFPDLTLTEISFAVVPSNYLLQHPIQINLMYGTTNDVVLSSLVDAGHFFLQQPTHPSHPQLSVLLSLMNDIYSNSDAPSISEVREGIICVAEVHDGWYRAQVVDVSGDDCCIKFVDFGGFAVKNHQELRQIRTDLMTLPFQASQCYLAHVEPADGINWTEDANICFEQLAQGQILQAVVAGCSEDGVPTVTLCSVQGETTTHINAELVNRGHARWCHYPNN